MIGLWGGHSDHTARLARRQSGITVPPAIGGPLSFLQSGQNPVDQVWLRLTRELGLAHGVSATDGAVSIFPDLRARSHPEAAGWNISPAGLD